MIFTKVCSLVDMYFYVRLHDKDFIIQLFKINKPHNFRLGNKNKVKLPHTIVTIFVKRKREIWKFEILVIFIQNSLLTVINIVHIIIDITINIIAYRHWHF